MAERPEDLNLPGSIVSRIIKDALPDGTKVSKEAQQAIAKAASVFVLYATSCSNQVSLLDGWKFSNLSRKSGKIERNSLWEWE